MIEITPSITARSDTWECRCGNVNSNSFNHRVITVADGGPFGGESGYDVSVCLKCGSEKPFGQSWYDATRPHEKKVEVAVTPMVSVKPS